MLGFKHYIKLDEKNNVISGFSSAFKNPSESDVCINNNGGRHFEIDGIINPSLTDENGMHLYKYDGEIFKKTEDEISTEFKMNKTNTLLNQLTLEDRIDRLELLILESNEVI